jgi:hypothetical protein
VLVILFLALYPQFALHRSEGSVKTAVGEAHAYAEVGHLEALADASRCPSPAVQRFEGIDCEETRTDVARGYAAYSGAKAVWVNGR